MWKMFSICFARCFRCRFRPPRVFLRSHRLRSRREGVPGDPAKVARPRAKLQQHVPLGTGHLHPLSAVERRAAPCQRVGPHQALFAFLQPSQARWSLLSFSGEFF